MGPQVPLGKREDQRLEFKSAEALRNQFSISREVVGMLNADGGEVWVGLKEANGIAVEVEDLKDVERKRQSLLDHLLEVIEPRLRAEDVQVETVSRDSVVCLLVRVRAAPDRGPFAQVKDGGRQFLVRIDHRIRPMTREEIFMPRASTTKETNGRRLAELRDQALKTDRSGLWLGIQPIPALLIDVQQREVAMLLEEPTKSGNRESGWNFRYPAVLGVRPVLERGRIRLGEEGNRKTTVWKDGCVEFWVPVTGLKHRTDSMKEIHPLALLEYSVSVMRLAKAIYNQVANSSPNAVLVDLAMMRVEGWHLPAYAPGTYGYDFRHGSPSELDGGQYLQPDPLRIPWGEFEERPDRAAFVLLRALYEGFHLPEDRLPKQYDRLTHCLLLDD